jgi:hypothetical protein
LTQINTRGFSLLNQHVVLMVLLLMRACTNVYQVLEQIFEGDWRAVFFPRWVLVESEAFQTIRRVEQEAAVEARDRMVAAGTPGTPIKLQHFREDRKVLSCFTNGPSALRHISACGQAKESLFQINGGSDAVTAWAAQRGVNTESATMMDVVARCAQLEPPPPARLSPLPPLPPLPPPPPPPQQQQQQQEQQQQEQHGSTTGINTVVYIMVGFLEYTQTFC